MLVRRGDDLLLRDIDISPGAFLNRENSPTLSEVYGLGTACEFGNLNFARQVLKRM